MNPTPVAPPTFGQTFDKQMRVYLQPGHAAFDRLFTEEDAWQNLGYALRHLFDSIDRRAALSAQPELPRNLATIIERYRAAVGPLLPAPHPDATVLARELITLTLLGSRLISLIGSGTTGWSVPRLVTEDIALDAVGAQLLRVQCAATLAILSQPTPGVPPEDAPLAGTDRAPGHRFNAVASAADATAAPAE